MKFPIEIGPQNIINQNSQSKQSNNSNENNFPRRNNGPYGNSEEAPLLSIGINPGQDNALSFEMHYQEILKL